MLKIKAALLSDAAGIARVHVDSWRATYQGLINARYLEELSYDEREELWKKVLAPSPSTASFTFVLKDDESQIYGFVSGGPGREPLDRETGEIYAFYLMASHQRQGYGRTLLAEALTQLALRGYTKAALWVLEGNQAAQFYKKFGAVSGATRAEMVGNESLSERQFQWDDLPSAIKQLHPKHRHPSIRNIDEQLSFDNSSYSGSSELLGIDANFGRFFAFRNIGLHYEQLLPGRRTSMPHAHEDEDEFIYVISGHPQVWIDGERYPLKPGDGIGFPAGTGISHTLINDSEELVELMILGDRPTANRRFFYSLHPELNERAGKFYWADHPKRELGPDDALPRRPQSLR